MINISLNIITEQHLQGKWTIINREVNNPAVEKFASARAMVFEQGAFKSLNGKVVEGKLQFLREKEIIYNPQLRFFDESGNEVASAIITRLLSEKIGNGQQYKLTLYFSRGLELILLKQMENSK